MTKQEFIEKIAAYVIKYAASYGIKVHSPIIAQAILESGWGESKLASKYHNYFGLKCGSRWTGKSVNLTTSEEYTPGVHTTIKDNFRVYDSMEEGVKGYFEFIQLDRYSNLKGITDPKKYLETIRADGYATSSTYVQNTFKLVEQYNLTQYDGKESSKVGISRTDIVNQAKAWIGCKESDGSHKKIIDVYNAHSPLARGYKVQYTDAWCATFVSAVAIKCGATGIIPTECSCFYMVEALKKLGEWVENDAYTPSAGDIIFYDWGDSGSGDDTAAPDHVGIVEKVSNGKMTIIEGNYSNSVKRRTLSVNGRYIRGFGVPKYSSNTSESNTSGTSSNASKTLKSVETVAKEVIDGKWGNGDERKKALVNAGYDFAAVQAKVNELLKSDQKVTTKPSSTATSTSKALNKTPKWVGRVTASALNVRTWAGTEHSNIKSYPLLYKNNLIDVCDTVKDSKGADWYYVRIAGKVYGFVHSSYVVKH